ncbi:MAG: hypothetical protein HYR68_00630 [Burkholderiales bacterium]|nr:hypothetical protein [Burkholderiales bacterium]MBI3728432.1 hypothetical protein [Burkholderiales bacterium]
MHNSTSTLRQQLTGMSWFGLLKILMMVFIASLLLTIALPSYAALLKEVTTISLLLVIVLKDLLEAPTAIRRAKASRQHGGNWLQFLAALLPPEFPAVLRLERTMWAGCWQWLTRKTPAAPVPGRVFGFWDKGSYSTIFIVILLALATEVPFSALMVSLMAPDAHTRMLVHGIMLMLTMYSMVWLLGDRYWVRHSCHVLTEDALQLQLGSRSSGVISYAAICSCERFVVDDKQPSWKKFDYPENSIVITPFDKPNLVISLHANAQVQISHFQLQKTDVQQIYLYVDEPGQLTMALQAYLATQEIAVQ